MIALPINTRAKFGLHEDNASYCNVDKNHRGRSIPLELVVHYRIDQHSFTLKLEAAVVINRACILPRGGQ